MSAGKDIANTTDWSKFTWPVNNTCTCVCGQLFRSHAKFIMTDVIRGMISKDPCPYCDNHILTRIESDPENWSMH